MEYTDEMSAVRERRALNQADWIKRVESRIAIGIRRGLVKPGVKPRTVAFGMWVLIEGLIRNWLMAPQFDLVKMGGEIIETHLASLRV
jgi:TetR/AcrR family acrAB operon transcriptional repressor